MEWIALIIVTAIGLAAGATALMARRHGWLWGTVPAGVTELGDGPFRTTRFIQYAPSGVPGVVRAASVTSIIWALLTAIVFAPAGLLFALLCTNFSVLATLAVLGISIHGFCIAGRLFGASKAVMVRDVPRALRAANVSVIHHILVIVTFMFVCFATRMNTSSEAFALFALAAVPCLVGIGFAALLSSAAAEARKHDHSHSR